MASEVDTSAAEGIVSGEPLRPAVPRPSPHRPIETLPRQIQPVVLVPSYGTFDVNEWVTDLTAQLAMSQRIHEDAAAGQRINLLDTIVPVPVSITAVETVMLSYDDFVARVMPAVHARVPADPLVLPVVVVPDEMHRLSHQAIGRSRGTSHADPQVAFVSASGMRSRTLPHELYHHASGFRLSGPGVVDNDWHLTDETDLLYIYSDGPSYVLDVGNDNYRNLADPNLWDAMKHPMFRGPVAVEEKIVAAATELGDPALGHWRSGTYRDGETWRKDYGNVSLVLDEAINTVHVVDSRLIDVIDANGEFAAWGPRKGRASRTLRPATRVS